MNATALERTAGFATGLALLLPITLSVMAIVLLAPILPQLQAAFAGTPGADYLVPMVLTIPALCVALLSPVAGWLGDRYGRRRLLLLALLVYGAVGLAPLVLTDLYALLLSRVAVGVAEALIMVLTTTLIGDYFSGAQRDRWLAAQTATASLSALLFFNLGGYLGRFGWQAPFWVYGTALLMLVGVLRHTWEPANPVTQDAAPEGAFPIKRYGGILLVTIFASTLFYTVQIHASLGLDQLGLKDPAQIGFQTSIASLGVPLGTFIYSRLTTVPVARLLLAEFVLLAVGFSLMSTAQSTQAFLIGCFINQLGAGMILPTLLVWSMSQLHFAVRGRGAGIWQGAFALGQWISPIVVTFFALRMGGMLPALSVLAGAAAVAAVAALAMALRKAPAALSGA